MGVFSKNPQCKVPGNYQYVFLMLMIKKVACVYYMLWDIVLVCVRTCKDTVYCAEMCHLCFHRIYKSPCINHLLYDEDGIMDLEHLLLIWKSSLPVLKPAFRLSLAG